MPGDIKSRVLNTNSDLNRLGSWQIVWIFSVVVGYLFIFASSCLRHNQLDPNQQLIYHLPSPIASVHRPLPNPSPYIPAVASPLQP